MSSTDLLTYLFTMSSTNLLTYLQWAVPIYLLIYNEQYQFTYLLIYNEKYFLRQAHTGNQYWKLGRGIGINEGEWTGKAKIRARKKFLALGEAYLAIFWPTPGEVVMTGIKWKHFNIIFILRYICLWCCKFSVSCPVSHQTHCTDSFASTWRGWQ